ncbi:PREDICTED: probable multidrug resistance-associated protein lethal(2)03659 [Ceratosolen solmsi marchali]|uniref:Probable multidrug resistance-associated protein lethal(2)03659 n=1 Tax=Ceratosolen solmsi marchali TaxID=326594 RepID=A0AAJ6YVX5_9HYME|nr:PREDICTED: probable multidrug resistance-associated protein lethal(2)03659 [Ceratosolen solmsi marchali]
MDSKIHIQKPKNPREGANPLSVLTFSYILRLFWVGYNRDLDIQDLYEPLNEHTSNKLGEKIAKLWEEECQSVNAKQLSKQKGDISIDGNDSIKGQPSLLRVLLRCFGAKIMLYGLLLAVMEILLRVSQPLLLARLLKYFSIHNDNMISREEAYIYAGGVILCSALNILVIHPYMMAILHMGMKMRVACCTLIYRKSLKLSRTALGETTIGQAVNLLSNDVNRFDMATIFLHYLWIGPVETIIIMYVMFNEVQESAIIGVATLLMFIPLQGFLGKKSSSLRLKTAIRTDERVRLTNEIISGIQAIKMYTWEKPFSALVAKARFNEIKVIRSMSYIRGAIMSFIIFSTRLSLFVTILAYVLFGKHINAEIVFMLTAYYNILRTNMTVFFSQGITQVAEVMVSIRRLQNFMMYEEVSTRVNRSMVYQQQQKDSSTTQKKDNFVKNGKSISTCNKKYDDVNNVEENDGTIKLVDASAKWHVFEKDDTLHKINLDIKSGELIAIVGQVGAGKSSLLNVILNELPLTSGSVQVNSQIAYASQEPWLFVGTVRQNILFGRKMDQHRYEQVIKVCQLKRDFRLLPNGDKTIVGERGISLSGGQRARINLARAVYSDTSIYIFDDPLSAVDAHVGKHMFEECIVKYLKKRTRILVTHQLQFLRIVNRIIVLKDGQIEAEGTFDDLLIQGIDFGRLLETQPLKTYEESGSAPPSRGTSRQGSITSLSSFMTNENNLSFDDPVEEDEMRSSGHVGSWVYKGYLGAGVNCCVGIIIFILFVLAQFFASAGDFFISEWVKMEEKSPRYHGGNSTEILDWQGSISRENCIYIYSAIIMLTIVITLIRSSAFFDMCMRASQKLHDNMFSSISRATMRFFNTNTSGRILNRFSKDMGAVDELLPIALIDCLQIGLTLLGIIIVVAISNPWLLIPTFLISFLFYYLRVIYISTGRSIKRLEGITRSPVFSHLNASLQGLVTIRSFNADETLVKEFDHHQDLHSSAWFIFIATSRAFGFYLDVFCVIYIALVTMSFFFLAEDNQPDGGSVGLAITQSIGLTGMFQWGMRQSAELENQMTSVERILEYSKLSNEPPLESKPEKAPQAEWPMDGKIEFKSVFLRYSPVDPPVLNNLNFIIHPREKIGIVGRTGAGKSSLIQSLFRLAENQGSIEIDGINVDEIGLHDLRKKISIIPQEPFLFSGSLRKNLDPFESYEDTILWQALEEVELKEMGLMAHVNEGGSNMSVGQRQLVCLARAIVKNNPILVLDEATANVDPKTDELIQTTIRKKFENCTVLTIAHRLNTVMDSDRILVMEAGMVVEFDHPHILLQKESGYLKSMVNETGPAMAISLMGIAENAYKKSSNRNL